MGRGVNWRFVSASVIGTSHARLSLPCQDDSFVAETSGTDGQRYLVALASDGAGSARYAEVGAQLACEVGGRFIVGELERGLGSVSELVPDFVVDVIRQAIQAKAEMLSAGMRDFACTLVCAVVGESEALFFQVGDGAIVIRRGAELACVFWPESGEYANTTYFVTDESVQEHLHRVIEPAPDALAVMTDGLQRLALVFASKSVHAPFFEPMFSVLGATPEDDFTNLGHSLAEFLLSDQVNSRTDDDKTLVIASRPREVSE
jgi:hypothetical protein